MMLLSLDARRKEKGSTRNTNANDENLNSVNFWFISLLGWVWEYWCCDWGLNWHISTVK